LKLRVICFIDGGRAFGKTSPPESTEETWPRSGP
jgi:hypothetical protein